MTERYKGENFMFGVAKDFSCFTIDVLTTDGKRFGFVMAPQALRVLRDSLSEVLERHPGFGDPAN